MGKQRRSGAASERREADPLEPGWGGEAVPIDLELEPPELLSAMPPEPSLLPGAPAQELLAVAKQPFRVRLRLVDGELLEGEIFMAEAPGGNFEEPLLRWLEELRDGFFPLREPDGSLPMVHTRALRWIAARCDGCHHEFLSAKRHVRLVLEHGEELEGTVGLDVQTRGPRLSDLLNEYRPYLALLVGDELFLVNRSTISRAYDLGPEEA
jgi:hypothetical protein